MFEAGDTAVEFSLTDSASSPRGVLVLFFAHICCRIKKSADAETGRSFVCQRTKRDGNLCGEQCPAHQLWSSSLGGGHGLGGSPLAVVRSNEHLWCRSLFSSVGSARQHMRAAYEMGHCRVDGKTHKWPGER